MKNLIKKDMAPLVIKTYPIILNNINRSFFINLPYVKNAGAVFPLSKNNPKLFNAENIAIIGIKRIIIVILGNIFISKMSGKISVTMPKKTVK